jgi:hypothetical protein
MLFEQVAALFHSCGSRGWTWKIRLLVGDLDIELSRPCWQSHAALDFGALTPSRANAVAAAGISDGCDLHRRRGTHTPIDLASLLACTHTLSFNVPTCVLILTCVRFHAAKGCFFKTTQRGRNRLF